jgi:signal transduction histidine kinase/CheY-like chemotaxis protein
MPVTRAPDFRALFEGVPGLYLVLTPDLRISAASDAYLRATMTTREGILGRHVFEVFPDNPDDPSATGVHNVRASLERVLQTRKPDAMTIQKYDVRRPEVEGGGFEERYWSPLNAPVCGPDGKVISIVHRVEDVTDFMLLKKQGSEQEVLIYQRAQEVADANRQLTRANEQLARLYREIAALMETADDELRVSDGAHEDEDGTDEPIAPEAMLSRVGQLITGYKSLEAQLRQSQKMEAVGRLAGGVAHDFNNLLTVILGYVAMLREDSAHAAAVAELEEIEQAALRAAALTQKLLAFSRKQILQPRIIDLNEVVTGMQELLRRLIGEDILLVTAPDSGLGRVKADPHQIEQVIMNLVVNARDAMPSGGRIVIETRNVKVEAGALQLQPGRYVLVSVADTGHGMDEETAARVFEPFFTTKEAGKGTGLGLSTVYGIVEQSGGTVTVESAPGAGTTFRVYLPTTDTTTHPEAAKERTVEALRSAATMLLVEDEAPVRQLVSKTLEAAGYRVLRAASGEEALAISLSSERFDLLLTDVVMPGMTGPELVLKVRASHPECAVLFISGYDNELIDRNMLERTASFLPKPFTPRALLTRVGELLALQRRARGECDSPAR